jgi:hypothetical protein
MHDPRRAKWTMTEELDLQNVARRGEWLATDTNLGPRRKPWAPSAILARLAGFNVSGTARRALQN